MQMLSIERIMGREIIDSRGYPTVEAEVFLSGGCNGAGSCTQRGFHRRV